MHVNMDKTSYTLDEKLNKATIVFEIQNFSKAWSRLRKGASFESEFSIGRTDFSFLVHPSWPGPLYPKEEMSVYLRNNSDHDVVVDYSIRTVGGRRGSRVSTSECDFRMLKRTGWGAQSFMPYLIFVTGTTGGACGEKFCHVEKICHMEKILHMRNVETNLSI